MRYLFRGMSIACVATAIYALSQVWAVAGECEKAVLNNTLCVSCHRAGYFFGVYIKCTSPTTGHISQTTTQLLQTEDNGGLCSGPTTWYGNDDSTCSTPLDSTDDCEGWITMYGDAIESAYAGPCPAP